MTTSNYPQHIIDKANSAIEKGTKMSFEAICEMYLMSELKLKKKQGSKKEAAKWEQRAVVETTVPTRDIAEIMRENAEKNLPSSMR